MKVLWRYHSIRARGDLDIIMTANLFKRREYETARMIVARGPQTVSNLKDAKEYFEDNEYGVISDEEFPEQIAEFGEFTEEDVEYLS